LPARGSSGSSHPARTSAEPLVRKRGTQSQATDPIGSLSGLAP
jgi:hypothetical protein